MLLATGLISPWYNSPLFDWPTATYILSRNQTTTLLVVRSILWTSIESILGDFLVLLFWNEVSTLNKDPLCYLIQAKNLVLIDFVSRKGGYFLKGLALLFKTYGKTTCKALSSDSIHFVTVSALAHFIKATICHFLLHLQPLKLGIHPEIDCLSI